ncbi:proprotein convertase P-domain-containing protein [Qipengyuania flava]|uniref:proprotein convertase P-domain-containing protein n=1 Tax=Qipengyuania flava TaxID=192812 RepID=UPI001C629F08|nr:proprotein convertase P-domain-containing protein [Qipengyuania flava]QYJ08280.1 DUF11 domain-containing protein [Qipengyuania flava]
MTQADPLVSSAIVRAARLLVLLCAAILAAPAIAQTTTTYTNTTTGTISGTTTCTAPLVRNFTVGSSFTVADVNLGVLATHSWRGDIRITLQAPDGTRVQLVDGDPSGGANISGDNFNVLLDDSGTQTVNTDTGTTSHSSTAPPYQHTFVPNAPLSGFSGLDSAGTWRLEICDTYPSADDGSFRRADLSLTSVPANFADLSLSKAIVSSDPVNGGIVSYQLTVTNSSPSTQTATGVTVQDSLPASLTFVSSSGAGSYSSTSGVWTVPDLAPGDSATINLTAEISASAGTVITNTAEISTSGVTDSDSTPGNGATSEDDYDSASLTVQTGRVAGIAPTLNCLNGSGLFDWDDPSVSWTAGSTSGQYALGSFGQIDFSLSNDGAYINNATFGGQSPTQQSVFTGGLSPAEESLGILSNQASQSGAVTVTISLPRAFDGLQFTIFDVDYGANQFADRVVVTGSSSGSTILPTLTNGNTNYVSGNEAFGDLAADSDSGRGNLVVTFSGKVDTVVITYGNHSAAPADPGQQGIAIHDIAYCLPYTTLSVTKISSIISDPVNGSSNPKAIPGALVEYLITVSNNGDEPTDADTVAVVDNAPVDAKVCLNELGGAGTGPILFDVGSPSSGLTYSYGSLSDTTDDLEFSSDNGATWGYSPSLDVDGCDSAISDFRVRPSGQLLPSSSFSLRVRLVVM